MFARINAQVFRCMLERLDHWCMDAYVSVCVCVCLCVHVGNNIMICFSSGIVLILSLIHI